LLLLQYEREPTGNEPIPTKRGVSSHASPAHYLAEELRFPCKAAVCEITRLSVEGG
jgi:hypothetical protein